MIAQIILSLSILVGLHEIGHLLAAKWFGMRVEQYSIGFPPKIFGMKFGETEYSIGAIPLGGFVKISGMIDESLDTEKLKEEPEPWEFRAKPAWQRLIVMIGGIVLNVILGIAIFIFITYIYGESYVTKNEANKHGIYVEELGQYLGLRTGDKITKINGQDFEKFGEISHPSILLEKGSFYTVERDGQTLDIPIGDDFITKLSDSKEKGFISYLIPFEVGKISKGSGAELAGLQAEDKILKVNGASTPYFQQFSNALSNNKNKEILLEVDRTGENMELTAKVNEEGILGFRPVPLVEEHRVEYSFGESIGLGTAKAFNLTILNIRGFGKVLTGDVPLKSVKGPLGIAELFGSIWDWQWFWFLTGMLSMWLAFVNFLPIPALDGGHVAFLSYEIISGRKPSDKFLENAQKVGMVFLLALMAFVIGNDLFNFDWSRWFS